MKNNLNIKINIDKVRLDGNYSINNVNGNLNFSNNDLVDANLSGSYSKDQKIKFTINTKNGEKITTFFSDYASPFIQRYKFVKGFNEGSLDFNSSKVGNKTNSNLRIYDFKIKDGKAMFYKGMLYLAIDEDKKGCDYLNQAVQANYSGEGSLTVYNRFCWNSP